MLAENPVVASHNRGHDELIKHGKTGFLVEPDDIDGMSEFLLQLLSDRSMRNEFGRNARAFALEYSFDNVKKELKEVYGL